MPRQPPARVAQSGMQGSETATLELLGSALRAVASKIGLIGRATPDEAHLERARLLADYTAGRERLPTWVYSRAPDDMGELQRALERLESSLRQLEGSPLGLLYRERTEELRVELHAASAAGHASFAAAASARYPGAPESPDATLLARRWCEARRARPEADVLLSDDPDPRSLISRLRAEVSRRNLPFVVRTNRSMSALAAISGDTLWVAEGRRLGVRDVERTVIHEIEAHALPRTRARAQALAIFTIGTAGGSDDQEGYALWLEETRSVSSPARRRELGARHEAVAMMRAGADFVGVVRAMRELGLELESALRIAERAFRGSHGKTPGLGRESVYLEAYVRVKKRLARAPGDEAILAAGQVAVPSIDVLRPWAR